MINEFGPRLAEAWKKYRELFGAVPHGSEKQMAALLELADFDGFTKGKVAEAEKQYDKMTHRAGELQAELTGVEKRIEIADRLFQAATLFYDLATKQGFTFENYRQHDPFRMALADWDQAARSTKKGTTTCPKCEHVHEGRCKGRPVGLKGESWGTCDCTYKG